MEAKNELPPWFLITVGLRMILPPHLRVYSGGGSKHNFSYTVVQNCGSSQSSSHFWSCTRAMLRLLREPFLNPLSMLGRRLHMNRTAPEISF